MNAPNDRKYTESHEWHLVQGNTVTIGITKIAADQLSDITFVDLPAVGAAVTAGKAFGEIESVKATSELFSGVSGKVTAVNTDLADHPEWVNSDSYGKAWMIKLQTPNPAEVEKLLSADQYNKKVPG